MHLTPSQKSALQALMSFLVSDQKAFVIAGPAGTGKTALIKEAIKEYEKVSELQKILDVSFKPYEWAFTATTNKAVTVLGEALNKIAFTIHSFLGMRITHEFSSKGIVPTLSSGVALDHPYILVIDEASFIDSRMLKSIMEMTPGSKIIFLGDPAQLPPVKESYSPVFKAGFPTANLVELVRQRDSQSLQNLCSSFRDAALNNTSLPKVYLSPEICHMPQEEFNKALLQEFSRSSWQPSESRVLCWRNEQVKKYNDLIQSHINGAPIFKAGDWVVLNEAVKGIGTDFLHVVTDACSCVQENVPGQTVIFSDFALFVPNNIKDKQKVISDFTAKKDFYKAKSIANTWADLRPLYASTVNKAQGSTFDKVFIDLNDLSRCKQWSVLSKLLYVAISRASSQIIFTGDIV